MPYGAAVAKCRLNAFDLVIVPLAYDTEDEANIELLVFNANAQAANVAALDKIK